MTLATKNGSIILKDGKLAEDCGCCQGLCVCDATSVKVSVSSGNFLRHLLLRQSSGAEAKVSLGYIAAPSSGVHVLQKDTVAPEAGLSPSKWVSDNVPSPGSGRITAVVYRPSGTSAVRVTVGIPVWYWRSVGDSFKSLDQMIAESNGANVSQQGFGTLVVELVCDSQTGTTRVLSYAPGVPGGGWSPDGSRIPFTACDFTSVNAVLGGSVWWEGAALRKGQERLISQGMSIVSDTRTGDNIVTLNEVTLTCCDDEPEGACCEGTTCSVKRQCQCQGTGKVFKGVETVCSPNPCGCCGNGETIAGRTATVAVSTDQMPTARWCAGGNGFVGCPNGQTYNGCWAQKPCETPDFGTWVDTAASLNATFTGSASASSCTASLQGSCPGYAGTKTATVGFSSSPCKIYATVDCPSLIAATASGSAVSPYWAWTYDPQTTEYTALYYVFQYIDGTGANTVTQSVNSTPVIPSIPTGSGASWFLSKTVTVNMRLTLA